MAPAIEACARASGRGKAAKAAPAEKAADVQLIIHELGAVAAYIAHMKQEIGALRPNELYRDRIPSAHGELGDVVKVTGSATNTIMSAAEAILNLDETCLEAYRGEVETRILRIFEACAFHDITGQRISKVVEALSQLEKRLARFAQALNVSDANESLDAQDMLRQTRRKTLILHGPQPEGKGVAQDDIDKLFG